jgi:hypothetical protein
MITPPDIHRDAAGIPYVFNNTIRDAFLNTKPMMRCCFGRYWTCADANAGAVGNTRDAAYEAWKTERERRIELTERLAWRDAYLRREKQA